MGGDRTVFLLALLVLFGCGDVNRSADDYTQSNRKVATSGNDENQRVAAAVPREDRPPQPVISPPSRPTLAATLASLPGSLVRGESVLRPHGEMSIVSVTLVGGYGHTTYEGTVRRGSCGLPGSTVAALIPISSDSTGRGASVTYAPLPTDSLSKGSHIVTYGKGGRFEACGQVVGGGEVPISPPDSTTREAMTRVIPRSAVDAPDRERRVRTSGAGEAAAPGRTATQPNGRDGHRAYQMGSASPSRASRIGMLTACPERATKGVDGAPARPRHGACLHTKTWTLRGTWT